MREGPAMTSFRSSLKLALLAATVAVPSVRAADEPASTPAGPVSVHPATLEIRHHRHPHPLQVPGATADGYTLDLRDQARFASADPKVAAVDERGWVRPVGSGATTV